MTITQTIEAVPTGLWKADPVHSSVGFSVRHMGVSTDRSHDRALRDCDIFKDAAILQRDRDHMQVLTGLGLIEQNLRKLLRQRVQNDPTPDRF